jgi:hypothetical protein
MGVLIVLANFDLMIFSNHTAEAGRAITSDECLQST